MLGKLPVPGRHAGLGRRGVRDYCACGGCGWGCLDVLLPSVISLRSPSLGDGPI